MVDSGTSTELVLLKLTLDGDQSHDIFIFLLCDALLLSGFVIDDVRLYVEARS